jgi:SSS family transporter
MDNWIGICLLGYVMLQLAIAAFVSRFNKSEADYVVAGRNLGFGLAALSLFATWFGAETVIASSGAIAREGLSGGRADPFGYAICMLLFGLLVASRMRGRAYMTSGDFYRERFNAPTEKLGVAVQVLTSTVWAAAQVLAFGNIIATVTGVDLRTAILIGVGIVTLYTMMGGLLADVLTDAVQGTVLAAGLLVTLGFIVAHLGGWKHALGMISADQLHLFTAQEPLGAQLDEWGIAVLGSLTAQEAISRALATKSPRVAQHASFGAAALYLLIGLVPVAIGMLGASVLPVTDENTDGYLSQLARVMLPAPVFVVFLGALISAILSTIDSTVLSVAALLSRNIIEPLKPDLSEKAKLRLQRGMTAATGVAVYFVATGGDSIYDLIETTSSFGSAGLLVVMIAGLWLRWGGPWTGFATVAAGIALTYLTQSVLELETAFLSSVAACAGVYAGCALFEKKSRRGAKQVEAGPSLRLK